MAEVKPLKTGEAFPDGVTFLYVKPTGELDIVACGLPVKYDASAGTFRAIPEQPGDGYGASSEQLRVNLPGL